MTPKCSASELAQGSREICQAYLGAADLWVQEGVKTISTDEKTGIQALERNAPDLPMRAGSCRKHEYEYTRHGTLCLMANWDVVEGKVCSHTISETRDGVDFQQHLEQTVKSDPSVKKWRFILDNLNTHKSEHLVYWVWELMGRPKEEIGKKGKSGILKNMDSRAAYLSNPEHPVYFIYTPKHCSWLNQVEIWFSILTKKLLRRGNFKSKTDLREQLERFIQYFNNVLAKPFKWNYNGKPCSL